MHQYAFEFTAKLKHHQFGRSNYTVAYLPVKLIKDLPLKEHPRLRIDGELNGVRFANALHPSSGKWYLLVPRRMQKQCDVKLGDRVFIQFDIADQDAVEVPEELRFALEVNDQAAAIWSGLTPGKRRGFAYRVDSAKRRETRANRVEEVINDLVSLSAGKKLEPRSRWH